VIELGGDKMKKMIYKMFGLAAALSTAIMVMPMTSLASAESDLNADGSVNFDKVTSPVVDLINSLLGPAIAIVGALGAVYCVILGVKFAKAEEPQEREKAKAHLKNAIIGFVLIFVLMVVLKAAIGPLQEWATGTRN